MYAVETHEVIISNSLLGQSSGLRGSCAGEDFASNLCGPLHSRKLNDNSTLAKPEVSQVWLMGQVQAYSPFAPDHPFEMVFQGQNLGTPCKIIA